jgi:hypothetical protein
MQLLSSTSIPIRDLRSLSSLSRLLVTPATSLIINGAGSATDDWR